jgi:hypothetical protein
MGSEFRGISNPTQGKLLMSDKRLSDTDLQILKEIIRRSNPALSGVADLVGKVSLTEGQREDLREALADELCSTGLKPDGEPNERGFKLDAIIGKLMYY